VIPVPWFLPGLPIDEQVINERLDFLADFMASGCVRPNVEAKHHNEENPKCPFHGRNIIIGRIGLRSMSEMRMFP